MTSSTVAPAARGHQAPASDINLDDFDRISCLLECANGVIHVFLNGQEGRDGVLNMAEQSALYGSIELVKQAREAADRLHSALMRAQRGHVPVTRDRA